MPKSLSKLRLKSQLKQSFTDKANVSVSAKNEDGIITQSASNPNITSKNTHAHDGLDDKEANDTSKDISTSSSYEIPVQGKKRKRVEDEAKAIPSLAASSKGASTASTSSSNQFNNDRTVYIEGLPYNASEDDIREFFSSVGSIVAVRLPRWHDSGRLRGYGHVEFEDRTQATKALELDGETSPYEATGS